MRAALYLYFTVKSLVTKKKKEQKTESLNSTVNMTFIDRLNLRGVYKTCELDDNQPVSKSLEK